MTADVYLMNDIDMDKMYRDIESVLNLCVWLSLKMYYEDLESSDYNLMIEFVKDGTAENLMSDAYVLNKIIYP